MADRKPSNVPAPRPKVDKPAAKASPDALTPIINSLQMATIATLANVVLSFAAGYLLVRKRVPGKGLLNALHWMLQGHRHTRRKPAGQWRAGPVYVTDPRDPRVAAYTAPDADRVPDLMAELVAWLNTADVCVNPDVANAMNDISTMNKIMEYMALGKPIVQFDLAEGRFSAREASLYARRNNAIDLAQKIVELLENPEKRHAMGAHGRRRVLEELEWRHEAPKLLAAYEALTAGIVRPDRRRPAAPSTRSAILPPR